MKLFVGMLIGGAVVALAALIALVAACISIADSM